MSIIQNNILTDFQSSSNSNVGAMKSVQVIRHIKIQPVCIVLKSVSASIIRAWCDHDISLLAQLNNGGTDHFLNRGSHGLQCINHERFESHAARG